MITSERPRILRLSDEFENPSGEEKAKSSRNTTTPFSIRLSREERSWLEEQAGSQPLGAYIRSCLLGDRAEKRIQRRRPVADEAKIAEVLGALGQSRIPSNLNQLAKQANCGSLDMSPVMQQKLEHACAAVIAMRHALFLALGLKPE